MSTNPSFEYGAAGTVSNDLTVGDYIPLTGSISVGGTAWGWGSGPAWCTPCAAWVYSHHPHYNVEPPRYSCGMADHDFAQLKIPGGGKPRLFCRRCATTRDV